MPAHLLMIANGLQYFDCSKALLISFGVQRPGFFRSSDCSRVSKPDSRERERDKERKKTEPETMAVNASVESHVQRVGFLFPVAGILVFLVVAV